MERIQHWYVWILSVFFLLIIIPLILDLARFGVRVETWHKVLHIGIGAYGINLALNGTPKGWRVFCLANGFFFGIVALTGWFFPDLGGLDAFNLTDTVLHSIVAVTGIGAGLWNTN